MEKPTQRQINYIVWKLDSEGCLPDRIEEHPAGKVNNKKVHLGDWIEANIDFGTAKDVAELLSKDNYHEAMSQLTHLGYSLDQKKYDL